MFLSYGSSESQSSDEAVSRPNAWEKQVENTEDQSLSWLGIRYYFWKRWSEALCWWLCNRAFITANRSSINIRGSSSSRGAVGVVWRLVPDGENVQPSDHVARTFITRSQFACRTKCDPSARSAESGARSRRPRQYSALERCQQTMEKNAIKAWACVDCRAYGWAISLIRWRQLGRIPKNVPGDRLFHW